MVTFRTIAALAKRSDSWGIAAFGIAGGRGFGEINSPAPNISVLACFPPRPNRFASPPPGVERLNRGLPHKQIERAHASTMQINRGPLAVVLPAGKTTVRQARRDRG